MSQTDSQEGKNRKQYNFNMALAVVAGQVGCLTTLIVVGFLIAGLFLDNRLDTRPTFTIIFVVLSMPVTLVVMFWVVRNMISRIRPAKNPFSETPQEEANRGSDE
jgi:F0F1-type ATP synthase assembly protein I